MAQVRLDLLCVLAVGIRDAKCYAIPCVNPFTPQRAANLTSAQDGDFRTCHMVSSFHITVVSSASAPWTPIYTLSGYTGGGRRRARMLRSDGAGRLLLGLL